MRRSFDELVTEANSVSVTGWDFSWLDSRAAEQRPSWGYQKLLRGRLSAARAAVDLETGGGEVLAGAAPFPPTMAATEGWPPNLTLATQRLHPLGVAVVADPGGGPLPFGDNAFDFVASRHPVGLSWNEVARVLVPSGTYLGQHVGPNSLRELIERFTGGQVATGLPSNPTPGETELAVTNAGLKVVDLRHEPIRLEFFDVGAVIYFLRKVVWAVPGFSVAKYHHQLRKLHDHIEADGSFVTHTSRLLVEATCP